MRSSSFPGRDPDHAQDLRNNSKDDSAPCRSASVVIPKYRSEPVIRWVPSSLSIPLKQDNKPCLVLDLDETLVHATTHNPGRANFKLTVLTQDKATDYYVMKRPFLQTFLETMSEVYEIGVFTASLKEYADKIIQEIDPAKHIQWALYRDSCSFHEGFTVKNLECLPRPLERTILVDDRETSFMLQPLNGIEVLPFDGDPDDTELLSLQKFLLVVSRVEGDLRAVTDTWLNSYFALYWRENEHTESFMTE